MQRYENSKEGYLDQGVMPLASYRDSTLRIYCECGSGRVDFAAFAIRSLIMSNADQSLIQLINNTDLVNMLIEKKAIENPYESISHWFCITFPYFEQLKEAGEQVVCYQKAYESDKADPEKAENSGHYWIGISEGTDPKEELARLGFASY